MPYIDSESRNRLNTEATPSSPGELNYIITKIIDDYLMNKGELRYRHLNEVIGVLECAKLELYRRLAAPYEDLKKEEQGDVYSSHKVRY